MQATESNGQIEAFFCFFFLLSGLILSNGIKQLRFHFPSEAHVIFLSLTVEPPVKLQLLFTKDLSSGIMMYVQEATPSPLNPYTLFFFSEAQRKIAISMTESIII